MIDPSEWVEKSTDTKYDLERHRRERSENGFSEYDWWNFCDYIAWVNIQALEKFKTGVGFPGDLNSMDDWIVELDIMIKGFEAHLALSDMRYADGERPELENRRSRGMAVYADRFPSLWD